MHTMLSGEDRKLDQGCKFIAGASSRISEPGRDFVTPPKSFGHYRFGCCFLKELEASRRPAHIRGCTKDYCVARCKIIPSRFRLIDAEQENLYTLLILRP